MLLCVGVCFAVCLLCVLLCVCCFLLLWFVGCLWLWFVWCLLFHTTARERRGVRRREVPRRRREQHTTWLRGRRGFTRQPENSKREHLTAPALPNTTKIQRTQWETKRAKMVAGEGKNAKFWATTLLPTPFRAHTLRGPHPSGRTDCETTKTKMDWPMMDWPKLDWPKLALAKIGQIRMATTGLAKVGLFR